METPTPDPMSELDGIHRALRGIQFTLSACLFCWLYYKLGESPGIGGQPLMGSVRVLVIGILWVPYMLAWYFFEMGFNARRLKRWW